MTAPDESMTVRVSAANHRRLMDLTRQRKSSVNEVVSHLLDDDILRIELRPIQHERWTDAAGQRGLRLDEYVRLCVEFGMTQGQRTVNQIFYRVDALCRAAGIKPAEIITEPANLGPQQ
jgi:hypothetical protein